MSFIQEDMPLTVPGVPSHRLSTLVSASYVKKDTSSTATGTATHRSNPLVQSYDPTEMKTGKTETEQTSDENPDHINQLYETTIAQTRLTTDVDKQLCDALRRRATNFVTNSKDIGFCPVLQHNVDTGDHPYKAISETPPLSAENAEMISLICWQRE